ncbi:MAG: 50S ribosomal protein L1 [Armatimonadetes bacterium]|nr:50S ribosomal protein L1 [Armatimonadota bacterium]
MVAKRSKRYRTLVTGLTRPPAMPVAEALVAVKETATAGFDESVDVAISLGIDPRQTDQNVRGTVVLPHGTGRSVKVAVIADGADADAARAAGADEVGGEDLIARIDEGWMDFEILCATPSMMRLVGRLGRKLGPRMPNAKAGTVGPDIAQIVTELKAGKIQYRSDNRGGVVRCMIGKTSFEAEQLRANFAALVSALLRAKPAAAKGTYLKKIAVSASMGPSFKVDPSDAAAVAQTA